MVDEYGKCRKGHADAHGGGQHDAHDAVQRGFGEDNGIIVVKTSFDRANDGHGADAEDQTGADEAVNEIAVFDVQLFFDSDADMVELFVQMGHFTDDAAQDKLTMTKIS